MIYLDHNATTPILPEVTKAMIPFLTSEWGNPSSSYRFGAKLKTAIETARAQVAELIGAQPREIIFTSCATESNNAAILAALKTTGKRHIVTSAVEHSSVLNLCRALEGDCHKETQNGTRTEGFTAEAQRTQSFDHELHESHESELTTEARRHEEIEQEEHGGEPISSFIPHPASFPCRVTYLPVDREGLLSLADLEAAITEETAVVSLMWANNETGVLFPVKEIAEICRARGVLFHCDAVQAAGKIPIHVREVPVDYLSLTGHKFHAPKGIGALYVRRHAPFVPLIYGGHQENNRRGGTENVALIVGMGKAAELARKHLPEYEKKVRPLRDALEEGILNTIPGTELNGHKTQRLANTTNITFHGIESEALLLLLDQEGICASSGSACLADSDEPSHVVKAMKPDSAASRQMIRFSMDAANMKTEIKTVLSSVQQAVKMLRD